MDTDITTGIVTIPSGIGDGTIRINLGRIARAEARMEELAFVTAIKAPELARAMNRGYLDASQDLATVSKFLRKGEELLALRKASILLDELPSIMVRLGITTSNKEIREAVFVQDPEVQRLQEVIGQLEAVAAVLRIKAQGFRNAFEATKKVLGGGLGPSGGGDRELTHDPGRPREVSDHPATGTDCPVCRLPQYSTPSGVVCIQGHGF